MANGLDDILFGNATQEQQATSGGGGGDGLDQILFSGQAEQPQSQELQLPEGPTQQSNESPLNFLERMKFSFGDQKGRRMFLEEKFPDRKISRLESGKFAVDGVPVDPEGFVINDIPADAIADISDELVRIGGQILGATKGAAVGTAVGAAPGAAVGAVTGGAAGRAAGQSAVETIGRAFGMRQEEIGEVVKNIAAEGAIGGASEGIGLGLRAVGKPAVKFIKNMFRKISERAVRPFEQTVLNFTAGMDQRNIKHLQVRGAKNILTHENLDDSALLNIGKRIQTAASEARTKLGKAVETGKGLIRNIDKKSIDVTDLRQGFGQELQKLGLLDRNFRPIKSFEIGVLDKGQKELIRMFKLFQNNTKISPARALDWRIQLDRVIKFGQVGKHVVTDSENALMQGVRGQLRNKLIEVSDDFAKANKDFASFAQIEDALKGKLDLQRVEGFLKNIFTGQQFFEDSLINLNRSVGAKSSFLPKLRDVVAARDFASTTFRGIRTGIFSGLLGGITGGAGGFFPGAAAGIALSTPRIAGKAIAGRQALGKLIEGGATRATQGASAGTPGILAALLSKARGSSTSTAR